MRALIYKEPQIVSSMSYNESYDSVVGCDGVVVV